MLLIISLIILYLVYIIFIIKKRKKISNIIIPIPIITMILSQMLYVDYLSAYSNYLVGPKIIPLYSSPIIKLLLGKTAWQEYLIIAGNLLLVSFFSLVILIISKIIELYKNKDTT